MRKWAFALGAVVVAGCASPRDTGWAATPSTIAPPEYTSEGLPAAYVDCVRYAKRVDKPDYLPQCRFYLRSAVPHTAAPEIRTALMADMERKALASIWPDRAADAMQASAPPRSASKSTPAPQADSRAGLSDEWARCATEMIETMDDGAADPATLASPVAKACRKFYSGPPEQDVAIIAQAVPRLRERKGYGPPVVSDVRPMERGDMKF